jgi:hypothetical protein
VSWIDAIAAVQWVVRSRPSSAVFIEDRLHADVRRPAELGANPFPGGGSGGTTKRTVMPPGRGDGFMTPTMRILNVNAVSR